MDTVTGKPEHHRLAENEIFLPLAKSFGIYLANDTR